MSSHGVLAHYPQYLPLTEKTPQLSLGEGETPLVYAPAVSEATDCRVYLKLEGCNPTGSFKDRGMVVAVAKAAESGARTVICASTGNTSASAAAYAARAGLRCAVLIPSGQIARGKLAQAHVYGATILAIDGNFDRALELTRQLGETFNFAIVNSINPHRLEGQKTAAFEIVDDLNRVPDILALPVGNAGNITAYWKGFTEYARVNKATAGRTPKLWGFQAEGAAPIVRGEPVAHPETVATAIKIGNPASWNGAVRARDESGGLIAAVSDEEIGAAYAFLGSKEGVFCEPASAASVAGLFKQKGLGKLEAGQTVVCVLTGNGLKDPEFALSRGMQVKTLGADAEVLARALNVE